MVTSASEGARFQWASDQSLLVYFGQEITIEAHQQVRKMLRLLQLEPVAGVHNLHPAYSSLLVKFDGLRLRHDEVESILRRYLERLEEIKLPEPRLVEIPVCYGGEFGPDLAEVCAIHGLTPAQAIEMHVSVEYLVYFLGFVPGFAYLGELPEALVTPRLATARRKVPAGGGGDCGESDGRVPVRHSRWMEIDRADSCCDVQGRAGGFEHADNRRSRAICA